MKGIAVCCGFNNYEVGPLVCAENDAAMLYTKLMESGTFHGAPDLIGQGGVFTQRTTAIAILTALTRAALSTADLVWFSFSGHAIVSRDGELRLLLPGWRRDASDDQRRYSIGAGEIAEILRSRLASKKFVVILDTCYSGAFGDTAVTRDLGSMAADQLAGAGAVVISSCARDQRASDGRPASRELNGTFSGAVIQVLGDHLRTRAPLGVLGLFQEAKARIHNRQLPTLYVNGLTEDFSILGADQIESTSGGIVPLAAEVPAELEDEFSTFLGSVVQIRRQGRVGLIHAKRQLERLAAEFYRYGDDTFVVPGHNANVAEAFDNARACIVGCTTPAYVEEWGRSGRELLVANREFIARRGGRVIRFFFVRDDFERWNPGVLDVVRDHVAAGVLAVIVNVDSFGSAVLQEVFKDPRPRDLSSLECAFVDDKIFLKTHFAASGDLKIELDQRTERCQHEYKTQLRPFLTSPGGVLLRADLADGGDGIVLEPLSAADLAELKQQLETDLGVMPEIGPVQRSRRA
ncbi:MAG TPA: caspase family protein [Kofleriaceae bacterium]